MAHFSNEDKVAMNEEIRLLDAGTLAALLMHVRRRRGRMDGADATTWDDTSLRAAAGFMWGSELMTRRPPPLFVTRDADNARDVITTVENS